MKEPIATTYTKDLSRFIANLSYTDLAPELVDKAKKLTMHVVGVTLAGRPLPTAAAARAAARSTVGIASPEMSTLWGDKGKLPMNGAIMANATAADTLDWEDCSFTGHPSAHLVPVSMAMSEAKHLSGKDYITAVIGGFEVYQRVACYVQPPDDFDDRLYGWGLGSWQIWAGASCAGKLLQCDEEQFNLLMGATGCSTPVVNAILAHQSSDFYHLQYAITALTGVIAAGMAKRNGLDNIYDILDGQYGYTMMMRGFANPGWIDRNVGTEYLFGDLLLKHWPANMWIQLPLDCLDELKRTHNFQAEDITEIFMTPGISDRSKFSWNGYDSCRDAQFSIPYCLAAYMLLGKPGPEWYASHRLTDPCVLDLAARVHLDKAVSITTTDGFKVFREGSFPEITMRVSLRDGRSFQVTRQYPKGHAQHPFDWDDVERTFRGGAELAGLPREKADRFAALCRNMEDLTDMAQLAECLSIDS
ncbi:MmgE/PrpD family protein [Pseudoflavonifractor sp. 524-17]|uniref:MmgE/PrpD family protein n=1 Tax=Pseudoflavonifractor sp. 524-17 TaxID=2304577 RepID=UPI00137A75C6|nr:MmgE/PrpD family protein [Pseudoflavonifractor sp. 524-17]NCE66233.1 MmgE/PrpD family protein [Pseudoflavonifractor sp. 524-17]